MNLAIIGASQIASKVMPAIKSCNKINLIGFASEDKVRSAEYAEKNQIKYLGNYEAVYQDPNINAVYITTSNDQHKSNIEKALLSGKHVICEKPLVLSHSLAVRLFQLAKDQNKILLEGLMYRFHPQIIELKKRVLSGNYGKPIKIKATLALDYGGESAIQRRLNSGGGALPDLGCYLIDFVNIISENDLLTRSTVLKERLGFSSYLQFKSGLVADISASMAYPSVNTWEVICEKASLSIHRFNPHEHIQSELTIINDESERTIEIIPASGSGLEQFVSEFKNFANAINGTTKIFVAPDESMRNAQILDQLLQQA